MSTAALPPWLRIWGEIVASDGATVRLGGLAGLARIGDGIAIRDGDGPELRGEVIALGSETALALLTGPAEGVATGRRAWLAPERAPSPGDGWLGRVVDAEGRLADWRLAPEGPAPAVLNRRPPRGDRRRGLGPRLDTGLAALDTLLPLCRGQRIGIFSGPGVGKSLMLRALARGVAADVVVIGLIGERGRELAEFARAVLDERTRARTVIVAATSDQPALVKRRAGWLTLAVAEHFRDQGRHVLFLFDSLTRFAEAHREIALAAGEAPALRAFPPSTTGAVAGLCERAGPGEDGARGDGTGGDITAVFTVLVAGSDLDEPVADMTRGILDGHVVLDRAIAERGRFPAIDIRRSVSRSAPMAWTEDEAALSARARAVLARYEEAEPMIRAGLYAAGADPALDEATRLWPALDAFVGEAAEGRTSRESFARLKAILDGGDGAAPGRPPNDALRTAPAASPEPAPGGRRHGR